MNIDQLLNNLKDDIDALVQEEIDANLEDQYDLGYEHGSHDTKKDLRGILEKRSFEAITEICAYLDCEKRFGTRSSCFVVSCPVDKLRDLLKEKL